MVKNIKLLVTEFQKINNELKSIEQNLKGLNQLSIEEINGLNSVSGFMNAPLGQMFKKSFGMRKGNETQIYYAANNQQTFETITQIDTFTSELINWLNKISTVTNPDQLKTYFGDGGDNHGSFLQTLSQYSQKIDEVFKLVGATIKSDDVLINETSKLGEIYRRIETVVKTIEKVDKSKNIKVFQVYENGLLSFLSGMLEANKEFNSQLIKVNEVVFFNKYMCEEYLKNLTDEIQFDEYSEKIKALIMQLPTANFKTKNDIESYINKTGGDIKIEPVISNHLADVEIKEMVGDISKLAVNIGNPTIKQKYLEFFERFVESELHFDGNFKNKIKLFNDVVIRDFLTLPCDDASVDKHILIISNMFKFFDNQQINSVDEASNFVKAHINQVLGQP